ncbi:MAG: J domain-containing protein [Syntrophales bacterium]|nr:J domain-containing protein [Syntrophales bacterium]
MTEEGFVDYYELLQLNPNADGDTIERVFRHLAKKYHPDHPSSGDEDRFRLILKAYRTLSNPELRAGYDARHQNYWNTKWIVVAEAGTGNTFADDWEMRETLLSLLYVQRRRSMNNPGLGEYELARLLGQPLEIIEFHLWYLKAKDWVERLDTGQLAISAAGVDQVEQGKYQLRPENLLTASVDKESGREK